MHDYVVVKPIENEIVIVASRSDEVLFCHRRQVPEADARDPSQLRSTIVDLLAGLPEPRAYLDSAKQ